MTITMELYELKTLCANMAALGVATYQKEAAPASDLISQREAYWKSRCRLTPVGGKM